MPFFFARNSPQKTAITQSVKFKKANTAASKNEVSDILQKNAAKPENVVSPPQNPDVIAVFMFLSFMNALANPKISEPETFIGNIRNPDAASRHRKRIEAPNAPPSDANKTGGKRILNDFRISPGDYGT